MKRIVRWINTIAYGSRIVLRSFLYSQLFSSWGAGSLAIGKITALKPERIKIGSKSTLNEGVFLGGSGGITIGDNVHISNDAIINSGYINIGNFKEKEHSFKSVIIKDHAWICAGAIINPGVTIGSYSVVAAGAVVTRDVPDKTVVAGVPAKLIKRIRL